MHTYTHTQTHKTPTHSTEKMRRPWSQQARQLTPRRGTVAHLGNQGCCVHIHKGNLSHSTYTESKIEFSIRQIQMFMKLVLSSGCCLHADTHAHDTHTFHKFRIKDRVLHASTMLGGWVNPHREQHTTPQGQTSSPPKSFFTPTAKARPDQAALATLAEARGATHRARPRSRDRRKNVFKCSLSWSCRRSAALGICRMAHL